METFVCLANFVNPAAMDPQGAGEMMKQTQMTAKSLGINITNWLMTLGHVDSVITFTAPTQGLRRSLPCSCPAQACARKR